MNSHFNKWMSLVTIELILSILLCSDISNANEMPLAGISANGLTVRDEANIQIEKEVLYIGEKKIEVSYIFRNDSDKDIVTGIGFPIPLHHYPDGPSTVKFPVHSDFRVAVNGTDVKYKDDTRALLNGKDFTGFLTSMRISIKDFGNNNKFFDSLSKNDQKQLLNNGLVSIEEDYTYPTWSVETTYYWTQTFPAKSTTSIKHTYTPNASRTKDYIGEGKVNPLAGKPMTMTETDKYALLKKRTRKRHISCVSSSFGRLYFNNS